MMALPGQQFNRQKNTEIWPEHGFVQAETFAGENGEKTEKLLKNC